MQTLLEAINECNEALSAKFEQSDKPFASTDEGMDFLRPFFETQNETVDINFFVSILSAHRRYGFIGGGIITSN